MQPVPTSSPVVALTAALALVVMVMEAAVGHMGFSESPFLIDPESLPRVVSLSFRRVSHISLQLSTLAPITNFLFFAFIDCRSEPLWTQRTSGACG